MKVSFLLLVVSFVLFFGCSGKEEMTVTPSLPGYNLADSDTDMLQKERFKLYRDYGVILIDDVKDEDYRYTMTSSSNIRINPSRLDTAGKMQAIKYLRELLYDAFTDDYVRRFPVKCILGNTILQNIGGGNENELSTYLGRYYFAFAITKELLQNREMQEEFNSNVLSEFILKGVLEAEYGDDYIDFFDQVFPDGVGSSIYVVFGEMNPGFYPGVDSQGNPIPIAPADYPYEDFVKITDMQDYAYQLGVPRVAVEDGVNYNKSPEKRVRLRSREIVPAFLSWALLKTSDEKEWVLANYPLFKEKYSIFQKVIKEYAGLNV